jgi:hypothetical protein
MTSALRASALWDDDRNACRTLLRDLAETTDGSAQHEARVQHRAGQQHGDWCHEQRAVEPDREAQRRDLAERTRRALDVAEAGGDGLDELWAAMAAGRAA